MRETIQTHPASVKTFPPDRISKEDGARAPRCCSVDAQADGSVERGHSRACRRRETLRGEQAHSRPGSDPGRGILALSRSKSDERCRRRRYRVPGLVLQPAERARLRMMLEAAEQCGERFVSLRRLDAVNGQAIESRMVVPMPCGSRVCPECSAAMRRRHAARSEGCWSQFLTIGVPHTYGSIADAWRKIVDDVKELMHVIRRSHRDLPGDRVRVSLPGRLAVKRQNEEREDGRRELPDLQYAWTIEPHESGYPHLHVIFNTAWVDYNWIRAQWSRITGCRIRWMVVKPVWSKDGVCRYLAKYIAKAVFPDDIAGICAGRRLHYSSLPKLWRAPEGWTVDGRLDQAGLKGLVDSSITFEAFLGWKTVSRTPGRSVVLERPTGAPVSDSASIDVLTWHLTDWWEGDAAVWFSCVEVLAARVSKVWHERCYHRARADARKQRMTLGVPGVYARVTRAEQTPGAPVDWWNGPAMTELTAPL